MATLKQRLHRKNASGTYDTVYFETSGDLITGVVPIAHGGTGATTAANARSTLGITPANIGAAASSHNHSAGNITSGTLSVARGGTGRSTLTSGYFLRGNGTGAVTMSSIDQVKEALGIGGGTSYVGMTYNLTGIAIGHPVMWANDIWMCVHTSMLISSGTTYCYLASMNIYGSTQFDSGNSNAYSGSDLATLCANFQKIIPKDSLALAINTTVNGVTNRIFVASYEQMNDEFRYFNNNNNRRLYTTPYWTSSPVSSTGVYAVDDVGNFVHSSPTQVYGFRPFVCVALRL